MTNCDCDIELKDKEQSRVLWVLLLINFGMFVVELFAGLLAQSAGLVGDSLDMLADATVYGIGLYAVGRPPLAKINAAHLSGVFQIVLAGTVLAEVIRRVFFGSEPESLFMVGVGLLALIANTVCLVLLSKHRDGEVHMRASWIFSRNDVLVNLGVILGGALVFALNSRFPDLVIGALVSGIVLRGGIHIVKDSARERRRV